MVGKILKWMDIPLIDSIFKYNITKELQFQLKTL